MSAAYDTIESLNTDLRVFTLVKRADGAPITSGTVNWYLKALSGENSGKWWKTSDGTWAVAETANAMTHQADGHWTRDPVVSETSPWTDGAEFLEYAKESTDLHVPSSRKLKAGYMISTADGNKIADYVRRRTQANVEASENGDALSLGSEYGFIQQAQESSVSGTTLTVNKTDGVTLLGTKTLIVSAGAIPVTGVS